MRTGTAISAAGHGLLIVLAIWGLPWFAPREREAIRVTEVSFVTESDFAAAQSAPATGLRQQAAPPARPVPEPAPVAEAEPEPAPQPEPEPVPEPEPMISDLAPVFNPASPLGPAAPEPAPQSPRVTPVAPGVSAAPRPRPVTRVAPDPTPAPEIARPAEAPVPEVAPEAEAPVVTERRPAAAPPEASPEPEAPPAPEPLALASSGRPKSRPARAEAPPDTDRTAEVMEQIRTEVRRENQRSRSAAATPATPATAPSVTEPSTGQGTETTAAVQGPPMTGSEKDGLKFAIQRCWNVPAGLRDAGELKITVAAELEPDGRIVSSSVRMIEPASAPDSRFEAAYRAARSALIRCSPYGDLPREKYGQWRQIEVVFNPEGMVSW